MKIPWFWGTQRSPQAFMGNRFRMKSREWLAKRARPWGTRGGCQGTPECSGCTTNQQTKRTTRLVVAPLGVFVGQWSPRVGGHMRSG